MGERLRYEDDPVLAPMFAAAAGDSDTVGLILHGSRGAGVEARDSDYDLDWVLTDEAYEERTRQGSLTIEPIYDGDRKLVDAEYTCPAALTQVPEKTEWMVPAYASAEIILDKSGDLAALIDRVTTMSEEQARGEAAAWYDAYLNAYYRGLKAAKRGNELGARLHAADSLMHLTRMLYALERSWPPYHDRLAYQLDALSGQGWNADDLCGAYLEILRTADPQTQQSLQRRVEGLVRDRGYGHVLDAWGAEIERVTEFQF